MTLNVSSKARGEDGSEVWSEVIGEVGGKELVK